MADRIAGFPVLATFVIIRDTACWPQQLQLSGLPFGALEPQLPTPTRVGWLLRDIDGHLPRNYETLAAIYRARRRCQRRHGCPCEGTPAPGATRLVRQGLAAVITGGGSRNTSHRRALTSTSLGPSVRKHPSLNGAQKLPRSQLRLRPKFHVEHVY
jgi:hypothetical protein